MFIKRVLQESSEASILRTLMGQDSIDRHCSPLLDLFEDGALEKYETAAVFAAFKYLRPLDDPPFEYVGEILTVVDHLLQVRLTVFLPSHAAD